MRRADPPALALLELGSIARAMRSGDAMVKRADVHVALAEPVSPGKYLILITGYEAEVEEAWTAGVADAGDALLSSLYLPGAHGDVIDAVHGKHGRRGPEDSLGILETGTVSAAIVAADAACKEAPVRLLELRLARGIGGKGVFTLAGELWDVQASVEAAAASIADRRCLVGREIIARPDRAFEGLLRG